MAVKKYIKFDTELGYLENKEDINYFATSQMRRVAFGKLLGDFDENGLYVINKKIIDELIKMPKVIVEMVEEADLIRSKVKADSFFHFILTVEDNKASFKLLEKINYQSNRDFNAGAYSNINEYVLDEVMVPDRDFDRNVLYEKYNISTENDGEVLSIFDMDELSIALYYNIVEKLKINYLVQNELILKEKEIEAIEADYFEAMLGLLSGFEGFGEKVINEVQTNLAEKQNYVISSKPFFQKTVNEVLDNCVEQNMQDLTQEQKENFASKTRAIKENYYQKFKKVLPIEISQKSGVRFDANQIVEENLIGTLTKDVGSKGYISSDVRKIAINEDELQLPITKIKQIVKDNEEVCKQDNAKADDITRGRDNVQEFYESLQAKQKVDILKPETNLIKSAIEENTAPKVEKVEAVVSIPPAPKKEQAKKPEAKKAPAKKAPVKKASAPKKDAPKKKPAKKAEASTAPASTSASVKKEETIYFFDYGTQTPAKDVPKQEEDKALPGGLIGELVDVRNNIAKHSSERVHTKKDNSTKIDMGISI